MGPEVSQALYMNPKLSLPMMASSMKLPVAVTNSSLRCCRGTGWRRHFCLLLQEAKAVEEKPGRSTGVEGMGHDRVAVEEEEADEEGNEDKDGSHEDQWLVSQRERDYLLSDVQETGETLGQGAVGVFFCLAPNGLAKAWIGSRGTWDFEP